MKIFKSFKNALNYQHENVSDSNNTFKGSYNTGIFNIDNLPYIIKETEVLWLIIAGDYLFDVYEEWAIEYGVTKNGKWAAVEDFHCSCYSWNVTYYDNLEQLLKADKRANIILQYKDKLVKLYPFLSKYF